MSKKLIAVVCLAFLGFAAATIDLWINQPWPKIVNLACWGLASILAFWALKSAQRENHL
jgi:hypothetical protein